jgi:MFS family permease
MSTGGRVILGVACALIAAGFAVLATLYSDTFPEGTWPLYALAGFCTLIALACLVPASGPVALRIIGAVVCGAFALYVYASLDSPNFWRALSGFVVLGLPAGFVALTGKYPRWGKAAKAFGVSPSSQQDREVSS